MSQPFIYWVFKNVLTGVSVFLPQPNALSLLSALPAQLAPPLNMLKAQFIHLQWVTAGSAVAAVGANFGGCDLRCHQIPTNCYVLAITREPLTEHYVAQVESSANCVSLLVNSRPCCANVVYRLRAGFFWRCSHLSLVSLDTRGTLCVPQCENPFLFP